MCGIVGYLNQDGASASDDLLRSMTSAIFHRGPDDEGFFVDRSLALGFRRLSIIDLSGGHQPLSTADGRYTIVFNGEVYNYREIRSDLEKSGVSFQTHSDTEVVLYAYATWGEPCLARFNGMFAFAIWDGVSQELFLARDRAGKKPLYFALTPKSFVFASETKSLFKHPLVGKEVDTSRIATFLTYRYVPGGETLFKGIQTLPAGCCMRVTAKEVSSPRPYWRYPEFDADSRPARNLESRLEELLGDAVRLRMISDVPFGAFLSGGLDSSVIVALMSRLHPDPIKTFSIGFDTGFSEAQYAAEIARLFGCDHHEVIVSSQDLIRTIPRAMYARETPVTEPSDIPIYLLSQMARKEVTVVLSGEGSDEIFAGYPKYAFEYQYRRLLRWLPRSVPSILAPLLPYRFRRVQLALECVSQPDQFERYAGWFGAFNTDEREKLLSPGLLDGNDVHAYSRGVLADAGTMLALNQMLLLDFKHWLPANLLLRGDRMTMGNSLELRCPFLDYRLVEFAAREVPASSKIVGLSGKQILKNIAERLIPDHIINRKKWGFKVPVGEWFRGPLAALMRDTLLSSEARQRGWYQMAQMEHLVDDHVSGKRNNEKQLWILFQLELWHRMFIDETFSPDTELQTVTRGPRGE